MLDECPQGCSSGELARKVVGGIRRKEHEGGGEDREDEDRYEEPAGAKRRYQGQTGVDKETEDQDETKRHPDVERGCQGLK